MPKSKSFAFTRSGFRDFLRNNPDRQFTANRAGCAAAGFASLVDPAATLDRDTGTLKFPNRNETAKLPDWARRFVDAFYSQATDAYGYTDAYYTLTGRELYTLLNQVTRGKRTGKGRGKVVTA